MGPSWRSIATLFAMMFASQLALTIYLPAVPEMALDLGVSASHVQLIIPSYLGAFALMQLVAGPLSDAFGRRPVILSGLVLFFFASIACALSADIWQLMVARFVQAAGACTTIVVGRAIIRDTSEGKSAARAMSYLAMALGVGPAMAPFFGGLLLEAFDWRSTFYATAIMSAVVLIFAFRILSETLPPETRDPLRPAALLRGYLSLLRQRKFMGYSLTISFQSGTFQVFIAASPIVLISVMGVTPQLFGLYIMFIPTGFILASFVSGRLVSHFSPDKIIFAGTLFGLAGALMQVLFATTGSATPFLIVMSIFVSNFGTGLVFSNCYALALSTVPPSFAGAASALGGFFHQGWAFAISFFVASLVHTSSLQMGIMQSVTTVCAFLIFVFAVLWTGRKAQRT